MAPPWILLAAFAAAAAWVAPPLARAATVPLQPCRLPGYEHDALCGRVTRPLDPALPSGRQIEVNFAVLPALARNKQPDPVFVFAGGPGQSAIDLAGSWSRLLARVSNRRDLVLIDQRGTGRSARLACPEVPPTAPLATVLPMEAQQRRLASCLAALQRLPYGDLRQYTTTVAMQDVEAVRLALEAPRVNLVGGSYGTRAALEYQRQFPQAVRRMVLDGVAPPDMALPTAFSTDNQAALDAVFAACEADAAGCRRRHPALREQWQQLLAGLPRDVAVAHPGTGVVERLRLTRELVVGLVRAPLYSPVLAAGLPRALSEASGGRYEALFGLASGLQAGRTNALAEGMHFSVVCAEDLPRMRAAGSADGVAGGASGTGGASGPGGVAEAGSSGSAGGVSRADTPGVDFASFFAEQYRVVCAGWPRGEVPASFYTVPAAPAAVLVLSGGADPVTPPRHGARVAKALGPKARHVVVAEAGHGVMALPCMRDVLFRFIAAATDEEALQVRTDCAAAIPRPPAFVPPGAAAPGGGS